MSVAVSNLTLTLDEHSLVARRPRLTIERVRLCISQEAIARLTPADAPGRVLKLTAGVIRFSTQLTSIGGQGEIRPSATKDGRLRLELVSFRAAGLLPLPTSAVLWAIKQRVEGMRLPGVSFGAGGQPEIDLAQLIPHLAAQQSPGMEIRIGPVQAVKAGEGVLELQI
jgi:hypothetical protein